MAIEDSEDIRAMLEKQAKQRINPFMKGLSMLTGGIAGEFTGTNEQIRQRNKAMETLLEQQRRDLENERISARMAAKREDEIRKEIERTRPELGGYLRSRGYNLGDPDIDTLREMASFEKSKEQRQKEEEPIETRRSQMIGKLRARPDYQLGGSMAMPVPALETTQSLEEQSSYEEARQKQEEEARKLKSGYINLGAIGGTPEQIKEIGEKYPEYKNLIEQAIRRAGAEEPKVVSRQDPLTGKRIETIEFPRTYTPQMRKDYIESLGEEEAGIFGNEPAPGVGSNQPQAAKPTDIKGFTVKRIK